jgi:hypothetical protein
MSGLDLTCTCAEGNEMNHGETTINLEASLDPAKGVTGIGVFVTIDGLLECHVG